MKISLDSDVDSVLIRGYEDGCIKIGETQYKRSLLLSAQGVDPQWGPDHFSALSLEHLERALAQTPQIIILGSGNTHRFPDPSIMAHVMSHNIGFEVMTTSAACRTYNVLVSEGRSVIAGLILENE